MSKTALYANDKRSLYFNCGGRCSLCCNALDYDSFSRTRTSTAEYAHIIGDSVVGPRGNSQSIQLASDVSNIIILCPTCHTKIDKELLYFTPARLHHIKREHELRVAMLLNSLKNEHAQIVKYAAKIGNNMPTIDSLKVDAAVREFGYYASQFPIDLNPNHNAFSDADSDYWQSEWKQLQANFSQTIGEQKKRNQFEKVLLFAIAPIPLLIRLGMLFGDLTDVQTFQKRREPDTWTWDTVPTITKYTIIEPDQNFSTVAVKLSLSDRITDTRVYSVLGDSVSIWELTHDNPHNDFLTNSDQLSLLRTRYRDMFRKIRERHGQNVKLHIFPACPVSAAIEFGRAYMPKADPQLLLYDQNWSVGRFFMAYDLSQP